MFKIFKVIDDFILDIYDCRLLDEPLNAKIEELKIAEISNAYDTMMNIIRAKRKPYSAEFMKDIYPILEIAVIWDSLKKEKIMDKDFFYQAKNRMHNLGNFYGKTFELDMASRCLISNWPINYVEDTQQKDIKQIDYIFFKNKRVVGVECLSKRFSMSARENMSFDSMIPDINNHADKFKPEYVSKLQLPLDQRVLVIDITNSYYCVPKQLLTDFKKMHMPSNLDAVFLTWREDTVTGENHSLKVRYCGLGTQEYFTTTYAAEYHATTFFMRKYTEHEPTWGKWGPEESANESK